MLLALLVIVVAIVAIVLASEPTHTQLVLREVVYSTVQKSAAALKALVSQNMQ